MGRHVYNILLISSEKNIIRINCICVGGGVGGYQGERGQDKANMVKFYPIGSLSKTYKESLHYSCDFSVSLKMISKFKRKLKLRVYAKKI